MKKIFTITLSIILLFSLVGCRNNTEIEALKQSQDELRAEIAELKKQY